LCIKSEFQLKKIFSVIKSMTTIRELRTIAKERELKGYYKLRKAELEQLDLPAQ